MLVKTQNSSLLSLHPIIMPCSTDLILLSFYICPSYLLIFSQLLFKQVGMLKVEDCVRQPKLNHDPQWNCTRVPGWTLISPNLLMPIGTIPGAEQPIFLFQKFWANSAISFSKQEFENGIGYQLKIIFKRQTTATIMAKWWKLLLNLLDLQLLHDYL